MVINESLSKGLKERLWNELEDMSCKDRNSFKHWVGNHKLKHGSRTGMQKIDHAFKICYGRRLLSEAKFGSRNDPLMRYAFLDRLHESVKDWDEKTFHILDVSVNVMGETKFHATTIRIGEHAVSRVFQRHPEIYNPETKDFEVLKIIPEFQSLAQYGHMMYSIVVLLSTQFKRSLENISIPFVSKSGIFLGYYNKEKDLIDVRTFVADHQLTIKQNDLTTRIRQHLSENHSPMLPFLNHEIQRSKYYHPDLVKFYASLYTVATQFAELVTWNECNLEHKREYQMYLIDFLEYFSDSRGNFTSDGTVKSTLELE